MSFVAALRTIFLLGLRALIVVALSIRLYGSLQSSKEVYYFCLPFRGVISVAEVALWSKPQTFNPQLKDWPSYF